MRVFRSAAAAEVDAPAGRRRKSLPVAARRRLLTRCRVLTGARARLATTRSSNTGPARRRWVTTSPFAETVAVPVAGNLGAVKAGWSVYLVQRLSWSWHVGGQRLLDPAARSRTGRRCAGDGVPLPQGGGGVRLGAGLRDPPVPQPVPVRPPGRPEQRARARLPGPGGRRVGPSGGRLVHAAAVARRAVSRRGSARRAGRPPRGRTGGPRPPTGCRPASARPSGTCSTSSGSTRSANWSCGTEWMAAEGLVGRPSRLEARRALPSRRASKTRPDLKDFDEHFFRPVCEVSFRRTTRRTVGCHKPATRRARTSSSSG